VADERDSSGVHDEPSAEEFAADTDEDLQAARRRARVGVVRMIVTLLVVVALLLYFITPFNNVFSSAPFHWLRQGSGTRPIPLAPEQKSPKLPV
jgi:hypothetical protein